MAEKKKTTVKPKKVGKAPTLAERITDFSTDSFVGKPVWTPKKKTGKK